MAERLQDNTTKTRHIGNSKGFIVKSSFLEIAGMKEKGTKVQEAIYLGKHGTFIVHHLPGEQPGLEDLSQEQIKKLQKLSEKDGERENES